ncbi:MAG: cellulase family glycosylhydrolase [Solirubrobacteraceae bacterium]
MNPLRPLLVAILVLAAFPAFALASRTQESTFQDDPMLVYGTPEQMTSTLDTLRSFGVDRIRVSVFWRVVAPANDQLQKPDFDAADPAAYPAGAWDRYDRLIQAALARGILVNLNITSPVPRWASPESPRADLQETFGPNPQEFGMFVRAVGTRYSGTYDGLPRVDYWSVWNEPNQAGWLTPQWGPDPRNAKKFVDAAPASYRQLVAAAWQALADSGHGTDTILIGETAPQGTRTDMGISRSIDALKFIRRLYCLDDNLNVLKGSDAQVRNCPGDGATFVNANPALFHASGYAHHPYALLTPPGRRSTWPDWVSISDLRSLSRELSRIYRRYGQKMQTRRGVPLYLTEYGYQTKPDPFVAKVVSFSRQAAWINEAEYIAFKNPNVRTLSQFLLVDDGPDPTATQLNVKWRTVQSGLQLLDGRRKPSYKAYVTPIFLRSSRVRRGRSTTVFGMLRAAQAASSQKVQIQVRPRGAKRWRTRVRMTVGGPRHYFQKRLRMTRSGYVRILWSNAGRAVASRAVRVTVVRR